MIGTAYGDQFTSASGHKRIDGGANAGAWQWLPQQFDASILSDEANAPGQPNFTGAFVGMACQDMAGTGLHADFDYFQYRERAYCIDPMRLACD